MLQPDVIILGLPKMDGCSSLTDLDLFGCKKLTADGLHPPPMLQKLNLRGTNVECKWWQFHVAPILQSNVIITALLTINGCSSLADLDLGYCNKLTADGLSEFCAFPPPALQKLSLNDTNLESKCRRFHVAPMLH